VYINDLLTQDVWGSIFGFADDTTILIDDKNILIAINTATNIMKKVVSRLNLN